MSAHPTSPAATGDRGGSFEQQSAVCYLIYLLTQGTPPFMQGATLEEVHLQAGHLGWETDDLLLVGKIGGQIRKVAVQVKSSFTFSAENEECQEVFADAWKDFCNSMLFDLTRDGLALICGPLPVSTQHRWRIVLDAARASLSVTDWLNRLKLPGYHEKGAAAALDTLRDLLNRANDSLVSDDQLWEFARVFDFQWIDLMTPSSSTEAAVRSLLAITASAGPVSPAETATQSWSELTALVVALGPNAESFNYAKLPEALRRRHDKAPSVTATTRAAIASHSEIVERAVRTSIAERIALPRTELLGTIQSALEEHRIICISGAAGSGKSGLAKVVFDILKPHGLTAAFRAESFAEPHLNDVFALHKFMAEDLSALAALHSRKWIWVESVERLLEKPERHAFLDLLNFVVKDPSFRLILTCRDYQVESVRSATFGAAGMDFVHVPVPLLTDAELAEVGRQMPALAAPLGVPRLRELLRNLFFLEKAAALNWSAGTVLPKNEREFRDKVWREVIRRDDRPMDGMPQQRGHAFIEIALRRARKLDPFVDCSDLDAGALASLRDDGLIISPSGDDAWVATAHDVLEDWALLQWLTQQWRRHQNDIPGFLAQIGTFPALRRAYRRWLTETLEADPVAADRLVLSILGGTVEDHWRDDTLAAVLLSSTAPAFIARNEATLVADNLALLRRCIHLLRVACKDSPAWQHSGATNLAPLVPEGPAWGAMMDFVYRHRASFTADDRFLLAGLLSDWTRGVTTQNPYPAGAESAACLADSLLPVEEDYSFRKDKLNHLLAGVMLAVPKSVEAELRRRVLGSIDDERWDRWHPGFGGLVMSHAKAWAVARDFPDIVVAAVEAYLGYTEQPAKQPRHGRRREVVEAFGLPARMELDDHPASGLRGPFSNLLRYHPVRGIDLIIEIMNRAVEAYGDPDSETEFIEKPGRVAFWLPDGTVVEQWANSRLWLMYRGTSVAPYVLSSALMALETWLFELAETKPEELESVLLDLLRRSNNVAITAVVSSVAQAFPSSAGDAGMALLTCPAFFDLDRGRYVSDQSNHDKALSDSFPPIDAEHAEFEQERSRAFERPHRRENLELLAVRLQLSRHRAAVQKLLDEYIAELPPPEEQDDETKLWRLHLHRIDVRNFQVNGVLPDGRTIIHAGEPPSDVKEVVDKHRSRLEQTNRRMGLWLWAMQCWERKPGTSSDPKEWRERLAAAQHMAEEEVDASRIEDRFESSAVPQIAAICVRDHWDEMAEEDREWCRACVCDAAVDGADDRSQFGSLMRGTLDLNIGASEVLALLLRKDLTAVQKQEVWECLTVALTHSTDRIRFAAATGVRCHFWESEPTRVWSCIGAFTKEIGVIKELRKQQEPIPYNQRIPHEKIEQAGADAARSELLAGKVPDRETILGLSLGDGSGHKILPLLLGLAVHAPPEDLLAHEFFAHVARTLAAAWVTESEEGSRRINSKFDDDEEGLDFEKERMLVQHLAQFLLDLPEDVALNIAKPVLDLTVVYPERGGEFLRRFIFAQDYRKPTPTFWTIWKAIVERFFVSLGEKSSTAQRRGLDSLLSRIFLVIDWNQDSRDWPPLEGQAHQLEETFRWFAPHPLVIENYLLFLRRIGSARLLPGALVGLAAKIEKKTATGMVTPTALICLEEILGRYIYSDPAKLKNTPAMRAAVLSLLNTCVALGSSACYRQRDDFLTPTPVQH
jgi:energy-coupling factor transporter ATP-binding protein EcfA2